MFWTHHASRSRTRRKKVEIRKSDSKARGLNFIWHSVYVQWASNEILMYAGPCSSERRSLVHQTRRQRSSGPPRHIRLSEEHRAVSWRHLLRCSPGPTHEARTWGQKAPGRVKVFDVTPSPRWRRLKHSRVKHYMSSSSTLPPLTDARIGVWTLRNERTFQREVTCAEFWMQVAAHVRLRQFAQIV